MSDNEWEYDSEGYCSGDDSLEVAQRHAERDRREEQAYLEEEYKEQAAHRSKESAEKETADIEASVKKLALSQPLSSTEQASLSSEKDVTGGETVKKVTVSASHTPSALKDVSESKELDSASTGNIDKLLKFCQEQNISTKCVLMITIQKNRTDQFSSFVVDLQNRETFPVYPQPSEPFRYQEKKVNDFNICYYENLSRPPAAVRVVPTVCESPPFCCDGIVGYQPKTLDRSKEEMFNQLRARQGSVPGIVFSVRRQIDNRTEMVTRHFMLADGKLTEVFGTFQKVQVCIKRELHVAVQVHAFKNYKCKTHGLFFGVDLYRTAESVGTNKHHMRLNPFTQLNDAFLSEFFQKCLKELP